MYQDDREPWMQLMGTLFKAHPWHGVPIGEQMPDMVNVFVEIVPTDTVKYEIDKISGHLMVDRPQKFSNICPALYGLIPQTFCGEQVAAFSREKTGRTAMVGDHDPLDICVLTEKTIGHGDVLVRAIPIGGMRLIDGNEADDKIIAVMKGDNVYGQWQDISQCPEQIVNRLRHYFLTYKEVPGDSEHCKCEITHVYGREEAHEVIRRSQADYHERFGMLENLLSTALRVHAMGEGI